MFVCVFAYLLCVWLFICCCVALVRLEVGAELARLLRRGHLRELGVGPQLLPAGVVVVSRFMLLLLLSCMYMYGSLCVYIHIYIYTYVIHGLCSCRLGMLSSSRVWSTCAPSSGLSWCRTESESDFAPGGRVLHAVLCVCVCMLHRCVCICIYIYIERER